MLNLKHGGRLLREDAKGAKDLAKKIDGVRLAKGPLPTKTPFDYLLKALTTKPDSRLPGDPTKVVADLSALATAMVDDGPARPTGSEPSFNSTIPGIYTYWGQFIDHDLTANTDRDSTISNITSPTLKPIPPDEVTQKLENLRRPTLDLDSLYGDGPSFTGNTGIDAALYDGPRFRLGTCHTDGIPGERIPPEEDLQRDLPRIGALLDKKVIKEADLPEDLRNDASLRTRAFIADSRNDENLLVAQLHGAHLRFHNKVVDNIEACPAAYGLRGKRQHPAVVFERAQQLTRWHYQWLVLHDYVPTVTLSGVLDKILLAGPKHYRPLDGGELYMPLEYSVAAFRFGHSMVRGGYDHNRNFGARLPGQGEGPPIRPFASMDQLFAFTGGGSVRDSEDPSKSVLNPFLGQGPTLPSNWIIEFDRFTNKADANETHFARKIDTRLVPPLAQLVNAATEPDIQDDASKPLRELLRHLARRNLLRGYLLSMPTGQAAAEAMGVLALSEEELRRGNSDGLNAAMERGGFFEHTPLWYYVLKEAEVRANGNSLGELGSRIVCETVVGLLRNDRNSYLNVRGGWDPSEGVKLANGDPIVTIRDFLSFTGVPA